MKIDTSHLGGRENVVSALKVRRGGKGEEEERWRTDISLHNHISRALTRGNVRAKKTSELWKHKYY